MMEVTFEYCSLHYLNQWLTKDKFFFETLSSGTEEQKLKALKEAGAFYRVARNLPETGDVKKGIPRYKPVLDIIDKINPGDFQEEEIKFKILHFSEQISRCYGGRKILSLTTKFLWLKLRYPVIIYDSRARKAIDAKNGDIEEFYNKWKKMYNRLSDKIDSACQNLHRVRQYSANPAVATEEYINSISKEQWFKDRVFDIYLWHIES